MPQYCSLVSGGVYTILLLMVCGGFGSIMTEWSTDLPSLLSSAILKINSTHTLYLVCSIDRLYAFFFHNNESNVILRRETDVLSNYDLELRSQALVDRHLFLLGVSLSTNPENVVGGTFSVTIIKTGLDLSLVWARHYDRYLNSSATQYLSSLVPTDRGTLLFGGRVAVNVNTDECVVLTEVDCKTGEVRWNGTFPQPGITTRIALAWAGGSVRVGAVFAAAMEGWSRVLVLGRDGAERHAPLVRREFYTDSVLVSREGRIFVSGENTMDQACTISELDQYGRILWERQLDPGYPKHLLVSAGLLELQHGGELVLFGTLKVNSSVIESGRAILLGISKRNGSVLWKNSFLGGSSIDNAFEAGPRELMLMAHDRVHKYTIPPGAGHTRCNDLGACRLCGIGFFWNYTRCEACGPGCTECIDEDECIRCGRGYGKRGGKCAKKNSSSSTAESQACGRDGMGCICQVDVDNPVRSKEGKCSCPPGSVDNGTHCMWALTTGCPELCNKCVFAVSPLNTSICLECKKLDRVVTHRTGQWFVDCRCAFGHVFNGSACLRPPRPDSGNEVYRSADDHQETAGTFLLLGVVVAALALLLFLILICRRSRRASEQDVGAQKTATAENSRSEVSELR